MPSIDNHIRQDAHTDASNLVTIVEGSSASASLAAMVSNTRHRKQSSSSSSSSFPNVGMDGSKHRRPSSPSDLPSTDEEPSENEHESPPSPPPPHSSPHDSPPLPAKHLSSSIRSTTTKVASKHHRSSSLETGQFQAAERLHQRAHSLTVTLPLPSEQNERKERLQRRANSEHIERPRSLHRRSSSVQFARSDRGRPTRPGHVRRSSSSSVPSTAASGSSRSLLAVSDDDLDELMSSLQTRTQVLGDSHPKVGLSWNLVGNAHFRRGEFVSAADAYRRALSCHQAACGYTNDDEHDEAKGTKPFDADEVVKHMNLATTLANLGTAHARMGNLDESASCLEWSLRLRLRAAADNDEERTSVEVAVVLYQLGLTRCLRSEFREAIDALTRAKQIYLEQFGPSHIEVARVIDAIGKVHLLDGNKDQAMGHHQEALRIKRALMGSRHPTVVAAMMNVAAAHRARSELDEAIQMYTEVLSAQRSMLAREKGMPSKSADAVDVGVTLQIIGEIYVSSGRETEAQKVFKESLLSYREAGLEDGHPRIQELQSELRSS